MINWHRRRYCPMGFRPPYVVKRAYKWTYLYAAVEPTSAESFCMYLPGMDEGCLVFLDELSKRYSDEHLLVVLDGAPSHRSEQIVLRRTSASLCSHPTRRSWTRWRDGFGVQAKFVEQGFRERGPNTRCAEQDAAPILGESFPPQAAHRLHMVGKGGGGGSMTSIDPERYKFYFYPAAPSPRPSRCEGGRAPSGQSRRTLKSGS